MPPPKLTYGNGNAPMGSTRKLVHFWGWRAGGIASSARKRLPLTDCAQGKTSRRRHHPPLLLTLTQPFITC